MPLPDPVLLLTRPEDDSLRFLAACHASGLPPAVAAVISPILAIAPAAGRIEPGGAASLIFTSRHGVAACDAAPGAPLPRLPCHCVGAATGAAASAAGHRVIATHRDAQALIAALAATPPPAPVLHVRGAHARGDIATTLTTRGIETRDIVAYHQHALPLAKTALKLAGGEAPVILPLFSPRSAAEVARQWNGVAPVVVVAMSAAVADAAACLGIGPPYIAAQPDMTAMVTGVLDSYHALTG